MHVIRRAAALAHAFASTNYEQATAVKYLLRPAADDPAPGDCRDSTRATRRAGGGSMTKLVCLFLASIGVLAVSGTPPPEAAASAMVGAARGVVASIWIAPGGSIDGLARWVESGSLLLLATAFFGASMILRRVR